MFETFVVFRAQEYLVLCSRWRFFILLRRIWLPRITLPRILPRIGIWGDKVMSDKDWLKRNCNEKTSDFANVVGREG